ncbi:hypothetical protein BKA70DRAFT_1560609 [Coprinopsis sp. MPI-PUGE-AT-0042]|nr:hypothetical protein BKA70DRAFT_1560609 [Coprinopsis sp. MPI-PUGE-AT-0042]
MDGAKASNKSKSGKSNSEEDSKGMDPGEGLEKGGKDTAQIRSRITVVCKECKRLKLKCDRKMPCGSCVKRSTVHNCEYSQQATEKVDLQSLNNRIMDLELALLRVSQGLPPNYLPTYPPVQTRAVDEGVWPGENQFAASSSALDALHGDPDGTLASGPSTSTNTRHQGHSHHHHLAAPRVPDATRSGEEAANRAFRALQGLRLLRREGLDDETSTSLKHEQDSSSGTDIVMSSTGSSKLSARRRKSKAGGGAHDLMGSIRRQQQHQAQLSLPSRKAFYPIEATDKHSAVTISSVSASWNGAEPPKPAVTAHLCRTLPAPSVCAGLISQAKDVFATRPTELGLPLVSRGKGGGWALFENRCKKVYERRSPPPASSTSKAKGKASKLSVGDLVTGVAEGGGIGPLHEAVRDTLPFFALMCAVMAVGASRRVETDDGSATPAFLLALSQQAQEVYLESGQRDLGISHDVDEMIREERVEYIRASIVQLSCLLEMAVAPLSSLRSSQTADKEALLRIIGKMVTALQTWGHEPGLFSIRPGEHAVDAIAADVQGARQRTWWEALFYDSTVPGALGKPCLAPIDLYNVELPELEGDAAAVRSSHKDRDVTDEAGHLRSERLFLTLRARLTKLVHTVTSRMSSPGCCCGYTLDQAVLLWGEVQQWIKNVPAEFADAFEFNSSSRLVGLGKDFDIADSGSRASSYPSVDDPETSRDSGWWQQLMGCELALVAFSLVLRIFAPFAALALGNEAGPDVAKDFQLPTREYISASEAIIRISRVIKRCLESRSPSSPMPTILVVHDLDEMVLNATIACSVVTTSFAERVGVTERSGQGILELMHSVRLGLDLLEESRDKGKLTDEDREDLRKLRDQWKTHCEKLKSSRLKRKYATIDHEDLYEPRASPGRSLDGWARNSEDPDDRMDGGGHSKGGGDRGRSSESFSRPSSVSYDDHPSFSSGPEGGGRGIGSSFSATPVEPSLPSLPSEGARFPDVMLSRQASRHEGQRNPKKSSQKQQIGIRVRKGADGKPLERGSKKPPSRTVSRKPSATNLAPVQLHSNPSLTAASLDSPERPKEHLSTSTLTLSRSREAPSYSMQPRGSIDGNTNRLSLHGTETHSQEDPSKVYYEYPSMLPLSNQSTGDLPPTSASYPRHSEAYGYDDGYTYPPPPLVRNNAGDSSFGRGGHQSSMQSEDISPAYTPSVNPTSATGDYFMPPHGPHAMYQGSAPFSTAMPMHEGGPHSGTFYEGYYPDNPMQTTPSAGPANWQLGGHGQSAVVNSAEQWNASGPSSWPQP